MALAQRLDLLGIAVQHVLHSLRDSLGVKGTLVTVTQHGGCTVVAGNDDISTLGLTAVKDIIGGFPSL